MASRARKAMCQRAEPLGRFQETRGVPAPLPRPLLLGCRPPPLSVPRGRRGS